METTPNPLIVNENNLVAEELEENRKFLLTRAALGSVSLVKSLGSDIKTFWNAGIEDVKDASWSKRLISAPIVGASAVAMALDLPLHEVYLGKVGTHYYVESHGSVAITGLADGLASFGVEGLIATGIAVGANAMPKFTDSLSERLLRKNGDSSKLGGPVDKSNFLLSYGSGAYTFKRHEERERKGVKPEVGTAIKAAAFLGLFNEGVGSGASWLLDFGIHHPEIGGVNTARLSMDTVNALKSNLTWLGFIGIRLLAKKYSTIKNRAARKSLDNYESMIDTESSPQRNGLGQKEFLDALKSSKSIITKTESGQKVPLLAHTKKLYWYNQNMFKNIFGKREVYYYSQYPTNGLDVNDVAKRVDRGAVILANDSTSFDDLCRKTGSVTKSEIEKNNLENVYLNQYVGEVRYPETYGYKGEKTLFEAYKDAIDKGELAIDEKNGASIAQSITGKEARHLWRIYNSRFADISETSPINAGFDKKGFLKSLKDPNVVKVINRVNGKISTLALFETVLKNASWLNEEYYSKTHPEAYDTGNILLFLGIVSDEKLKGGLYSLNLINLLLQVGKNRDSNALITFECNEVSSSYLPKLVSFAINKSKIAKVSGLEDPVASTSFSYMRKISE